MSINGDATPLAVRYLGNGRHALEETQPRELQADQALVRVEAAGICGSDLKVLHSPPALQANPGIVLGHEFAGTVSEIGSAVQNVRAGDRVVAAPNLGCGVCVPCSRGRAMSCKELVSLGFTDDGGFVSEAQVPAAALHILPATIDWSVASLIEPLSCVLSALGGVEIPAGTSAAVIGGGPMGLLAISVLRLNGAGPVALFEPSPARQKVGRLCGATHVAGAEPELWGELTGA